MSMSPGTSVVESGARVTKTEAATLICVKALV